uniref:Secreted protein n=1 Tax=Rhipicephalus microplus TaxID=6941 RepID=A0A6G5A0G9_RHIMP
MLTWQLCCLAVGLLSTRTQLDFWPSHLRIYHGDMQRNACTCLLKHVKEPHVVKIDYNSVPHDVSIVTIKASGTGCLFPPGRWPFSAVLWACECFAFASICICFLY